MFNFFKKSEPKQEKKFDLLINAFNTVCPVSFNGYNVNVKQKYLSDLEGTDVDKDITDHVNWMAKDTAEKCVTDDKYGVAVIIFSTRHLHEDSTYLRFNVIVCAKDATGYSNVAERHDYGYAESITADRFAPLIQAAINEVLPRL